MSAAPHHRTPLIALLTSHAISLTGNMMTIIALPLYVLAKTGSPAATGLAGAFATAPIVRGGFFGGVIVDRNGYRPASILADLVSCLTIAAVPLIDVSSGLPFWGLLALVFASGLLDSPARPPATRSCRRRPRRPACRWNERWGCSRPPSAQPGSSGHRSPVYW